MRKFTTLAASALILAVGATSAFAIPSGDRLGQEENGYSATVGHAGANGFTALAPGNADNAWQYTPLPLRSYGRGR